MPSPDKKEIEGALGAGLVLHGYIFAAYELVRMAGKEFDQLTSAELFPVRFHGELVWASVDNHAIHIFFSLRGPGNLFLLPLRPPAFPNAAFGVPRPIPADPEWEICCYLRLGGP